jgi:hypothetical protein
MADGGEFVGVTPASHLAALTRFYSDYSPEHVAQLQEIWAAYGAGVWAALPASFPTVRACAWDIDAPALCLAAAPSCAWLVALLLFVCCWSPRPSRMRGACCGRCVARWRCVVCGPWCTLLARPAAARCDPTGRC